MRPEEHATWERDFPVRYLLVRENYDEENGRTSDLWGRCADVEGLFMDPPPLPREVLTLRGCPRDSVLARAVTRFTDPVRVLGDVELMIHPTDPSNDGPHRFWMLADTAVLAHRPTPGDPERVDLTVGAGVKEDIYWGCQQLPSSPQFELWADSLVPGGPVGCCLSIDGLFSPRPQRPAQPLHLIGCEPAEPLLAELRSPRPADDEVTELWALDRNGRHMAQYDFDFRATEVRPSVLGGALVDITVADPAKDWPWLAGRPTLAARDVREVWYDGVPTRRNLWAPFDEHGRKEWHNLCRIGPYGPGVGRSGGTYHLDGQYATERAGLLLALGEALIGPGGTYGHCLESVKDHLGGGPSVFSPFTLVWHHADVARAALAHDPDRHGSFFEQTVDLLSRYGVTVVLR
ncbi:hypothetical protein [Kitasatospora purpeofusca]|uniref:hypothetical protein n=1 Tax=Kitasatospora purpeofusca TaxID=67352 RepID=UPI0036470821